MSGEKHNVMPWTNLIKSFEKTGSETSEQQKPRIWISQLKNNSAITVE